MAKFSISVSDSALLLIDLSEDAKDPRIDLTRYLKGGDVRGSVYGEQIPQLTWGDEKAGQPIIGTQLIPYFFITFHAYQVFTADGTRCKGRLDMDELPDIYLNNGFEIQASGDKTKLDLTRFVDMNVTRVTALRRVSMLSGDDSEVIEYQVETGFQPTIVEVERPHND